MFYFDFHHSNALKINKTNNGKILNNVILLNSYQNIRL